VLFVHRRSQTEPSLPCVLRRPRHANDLLGHVTHLCQPYLFASSSVRTVLFRVRVHAPICNTPPERSLEGIRFEQTSWNTATTSRLRSRTWMLLSTLFTRTRTKHTQGTLLLPDIHFVQRTTTRPRVPLHSPGVLLAPHLCCTLTT
jgi:hypothetical protein